MLYVSHLFLFQACVNGDGGNGSFSESGFSPQEEGVAEFKLWSPTAHSDPYELTNCALNSIKSRYYVLHDFKIKSVKYFLWHFFFFWRKTTEKHEIEEEVDLQCLVSSILDEGDDIQNGFYNTGYVKYHSVELGVRGGGGE